VAHG
jgi:hypothetical protein